MRIPRSSSHPRAARAAAGAAVAVGLVLTATACGTGTRSAGGDSGRGKELFTQKCGSCHVLGDAGSAGTLGPSLDEAFKYARDQGFAQSSIQQIVANQIRFPVQQTPLGTPGMPADLVTGADVDSVASYVSKVAGKPVSGGGGTISGTDGKAIFTSAGCGGCHTLKDAGAGGTVGPNLDQAKPAKALAVDRVTNGKGGMPSFKGKLNAKQIDAVAAYISSVAGK